MARTKVVKALKPEKTELDYLDELGRAIRFQLQSFDRLRELVSKGKTLEQIEKETKDELEFINGPDGPPDFMGPLSSAADLKRRLMIIHNTRKLMVGR